MNKKLSITVTEDLINILKIRFETNKKRHKGVNWEDVYTRLRTNPGKLWSLNEMERSGGEPDVVDYDKESDEFIFYDCSAETPVGRRNICYDHEALEARKEHKPGDSALGMAADMGVEILDEQQYRDLQRLGEFDEKTSSWIKTPATIRKLGGALFCDRRYNTVFVYHNGAQSYYAGRGFRGSLRM